MNHWNILCKCLLIATQVYTLALVDRATVDGCGEEESNGGCDGELHVVISIEERIMIIVLY